MNWQPEVHQQRLSTSRFLIGLAAVLVVLAASKTWASGQAGSTSGSAGAPALGNLDALVDALHRAGFRLEGHEEGVDFVFSDGVEEACKGRAPQAGNNPWPNVTLYASVHGVRQWQLGMDQALVLVGQTPPSVQFFHYQVFALTVPGIPTRMMMPVGDAINMATIRTIGSDKYNTPIVYIVTGNRETERLVRAAVLEAGYPEGIINVEAISPVIAPLGVGDEGSWFTLVHRLAVPLDPMRSRRMRRIHPIASSA